MKLRNGDNRLAKRWPHRTNYASFYYNNKHQSKVDPALCDIYSNLQNVVHVKINKHLLDNIVVNRFMKMCSLKTLWGKVVILPFFTKFLYIVRRYCCRRCLKTL